MKVMERLLERITEKVKADDMQFEFRPTKEESVIQMQKKMVFTVIFFDMTIFSSLMA